MILFLHVHFARSFKKLVTIKNGRNFVVNQFRNAIPQIKSRSPPKKKGNVHLLPSFLLPGGFVVKCSTKNKSIKITVEDELIPFVHVNPDESFDWQKLLSFLLPDLWRLIVAIAAAVVVAIINVQLPIHLGKVIDVLTVLSNKSGDTSVLFNQLRDPALKLFSVYVLQAFFTFVYVDLISTVGENLAKNLKSALFASVMQQNLTFFDTNRTGEIIDRLTTDVHEFKSAFKLCISQGIRSSTQIVGCLISLVSISPEMTGVMVLILPTVILIGSLLGSKLREMSKNAQEEAAWSTITAEEVISNIRTVRAFAMEEHECEKFEREAEITARLFKKLGFGIALFQGGTNIFLNGLVLLTLSMGGYMLSLKKLSTGNLMSFLVAMQTIQKSLTQISLLFGHLVKGMSSGTRVFQFIHMESQVPLGVDWKKTIPPYSFSADIQFEGVSFSYPTRPEQNVLKNFNLTIPAGKIAAIVGSSGNGKSTVASLLLKFYDVTSGVVKISGKNINDLDENWLRKNVIGFINQEPVLFATSIKENIKYGNTAASDEEIYDAARLANADEFIRHFPHGYDTVVGEKGTAISGGQKQRIAIARAFLKKPMILVLDEATSALDTISEQRVQKSLESVMKGRTVVIIAHRLSTIKNADVIVVLDDGVIVEVGKHDELIKKKGFYWNLMNQQEKDKSKKTILEP